MKKTLLSVCFASACLMMSAQDAVTYFSEDFEWLAPWSLVGSSTEDKKNPAGKTIESNNPSANSPGLATPKVDGVSAFQALKNKNYDFVATHAASKDERAPEKQIYLQDNYLKMGLTGYQSGLVLPSITTVPEGAEATLTFDVSSQRHGDGTWDATKLVILVQNGEDVKSYEFDVPNPGNDNPYVWYTIDTKLTGATIAADTKITIRNADSQWPSTKALRWFIDNIKLHNGVNASVTDIVADENAPVEYYNLQGVRVANPENGVYIRHQGNKASKVLVK